jgi:hypothetical protein
MTQHLSMSNNEGKKPPSALGWLSKRLDAHRSSLSDPTAPPPPPVPDKSKKSKKIRQREEQHTAEVAEIDQLVQKIDLLQKALLKEQQKQPNSSVVPDLLGIATRCSQIANETRTSVNRKGWSNINTISVRSLKITVESLHKTMTSLGILVKE